MKMSFKSPSSFMTLTQGLFFTGIGFLCKSSFDLDAYESTMLVLTLWFSYLLFLSHFVKSIIQNCHNQILQWIPTLTAEESFLIHKGLEIMFDLILSREVNGLGPLKRIIGFNRFFLESLKNKYNSQNQISTLQLVKYIEYWHGKIDKSQLDEFQKWMAKIYNL